MEGGSYRFYVLGKTAISGFKRSVGIIIFDCDFCAFLALSVVNSKIIAAINGVRNFFADSMS